MSRNIKQALSVVMILAMMLSVFSICAYAESNDNTAITPRFSTISTVATSFTISGLNSTSSVVLSAQYSTSLSIKIELQKEKSSGYETIETWTKTGTGTVISLEEDRLINVFSEYRIKVTCKAGSETHVTYDYP